MPSTTFLHLAGNKLLISFDRNLHIESLLKKIPGARFNKQLGRWESPLHTYPKLLDIFNDIKVSDAVIKRFSYEAELNRKVKELKNCSYIELNDYTSKANLMGHQKKAFVLHQMLPGSANLSEQGSGKTGSAICIAHWHIEKGHTDSVLVICPKSVMRGWEEQIEFFSDLTYVSISGMKKEDKLEKLKLKRDVFIINYDYTWRIQEELLAKKFNLIIADEAHRIKNPETNQSKACYALGDAADYRIALTGTPILNTPLDCFGILRFVDSSVFGESFYSFRSRYFTNVGNENSPIQIYVPKSGATEEIADKLATRSIRVLKSEVLSDLPPQIFMPDHIVTLSPEQDRAYRKLQEELCAQITETQSIKINHVLTLMIKLNQITSGWIKDSDTGEIIRFKQNPKFEELKELVDEVADQRPLIWVYYKEDSKLLTEYYGRCIKCKIPVNNVKGDECPCGAQIKYRCSEIQGSTKHRNAEIAKFKYSPEERAKLRQKFIADGKSSSELNAELGPLLECGSEPPQTNIFICQTAAASEGVNLQKVSSCSIYFSRNFSLGQFLQSLARNHRQGTDKPVLVFQLICRMMDGSDTVDQRIVDALKRKEDLSKKINKDDLKLIFGKKKEIEVEVTADNDLRENIDPESHNEASPTQEGTLF